ncbi:lysostaphin resistance A-like protein [Virgibacillus sp. W0181]|uniref:CPBP family intramembrane glutamic endopeptidase n=1 Tax=Virgibacillus sp. W0181 TaxID=3391581 RepID=UPI003F448864
MKQTELIKKLSDKELFKQLIITQMILLFISFVSSFFLFDNVSEWFTYFDFNGFNIVYYGVIPGIVIVLIDLVLIVLVPKRFYDDGGINERVFKNRTVLEIFAIALIVAVAEEFLFRGVIQTTFGYITASIIFALVHVRYLHKPIMFLSVLFVSFYIGYLFVLTENLVVTITVHFIVDFILGIVIQKQK